MKSLDQQLLDYLSHIKILPRRLRLDPPNTETTVSVLRGVWGAALHELDIQAYFDVFGPNDLESGRVVEYKLGPTLPKCLLHEVGNGSVRTAIPLTRQWGVAGGTAVCGYILRPAQVDPFFTPAVEWFLLGSSIQHDATLRRAWDVAGGMGVGSQRRRFYVREWRVLLPDGSTAAQAEPWSLQQVRWLATPHWNIRRARERWLNWVAEPVITSTSTACWLEFHSPLRLLRQGRLILCPTLADLVVAACRRVAAFLPPHRLDSWSAVAGECLEVARRTPQEPWQGARLDLRRYSARQKQNIELRGVRGRLFLPAGPGELWPLLAAAQWLHLGKATALGLGQPLVVTGQVV